MKGIIALFLLVVSCTAFAQDSTNTFDYNYKKGMVHYNLGNDITNKSVGLSTTEMIDGTNAEFTKAIPFLEKAYQINPKHPDLLGALQDVYFSLQDFDRSDKYYDELKALKKK